jgi:hypothetical protein
MAVAPCGRPRAAWAAAWASAVHGARGRDPRTASCRIGRRPDTTRAVRTTAPSGAPHAWRSVCSPLREIALGLLALGLLALSVALRASYSARSIRTKRTVSPTAKRQGDALIRGEDPGRRAADDGPPGGHGERADQALRPGNEHAASCNAAHRRGLPRHLNRHAAPLTGTRIPAAKPYMRTTYCACRWVVDHVVDGQVDRSCNRGKIGGRSPRRSRPRPRGAVPAPGHAMRVRSRRSTCARTCSWSVTTGSKSINKLTNAGTHSAIPGGG